MIADGSHPLFRESQRKLAVFLNLLYLDLSALLMNGVLCLIKMERSNKSCHLHWTLEREACCNTYAAMNWRASRRPSRDTENQQCRRRRCPHDVVVIPGHLGRTSILIKTPF
jgi:hypothetical protein